MPCGPFQKNSRKFPTTPLKMVKKTAVLLILAILFNALFVAFRWARYIFLVGLNPILAVVVLLLSLLIAIPIAFLAVRWLIRYYNGKPWFSVATIFLLGFFIFLMGEIICKLAFGRSTLDIQLHDTYFVIAHTHVMIFLSLVFLAFSAAYHFYPRIMGRAMNAPMGYMHWGLTLIAGYLLCWPVEYAGLAGMPRRYFDYSNLISMDRVWGITDFNTRLIILLVFAQLFFLVNLIYSAIKAP